MSGPLQVLLIEDNPADVRLLAEMLADMGDQGLDCELAWTDSLERGRRHLDDAAVDVVLLDLGLPGSNGLPTLRRLLDGGPCHAALVVFSGHGDKDLELQALEAGAQDYLVKGEVDPPALARSIRHAIGRARADRDARERDAALHAAKNRAEASNEAKSRFLAGLSHDLRTPLNGILGFAQLMQADPTLGDCHRRQAEMIQRSGEHLLALINDILDLAKAEAGRLEIDPQPFELATLVDIVVGTARVKAAQKPALALQVDMEPELPARVLGDQRRLHQVLLNLLDNAVKFTESGAVTLRLRAAGPARLACEVDDTGVSLTDAQRARLFQPFEQVGTAAQRRQGTGLGLVMSRQIVRLMGGDLRAMPREGGGNRFAFEVELPAAA